MEDVATLRLPKDVIERGDPMQAFRLPALQQLTDQQVRFAPPARRLEQLARADQLLTEIEPEKYIRISMSVSGSPIFGRTLFADLIVSGEDLMHDLYMFIAEVSRSTAGRAGRVDGRAGVDARRDQQAAERLDQDDQPLAQAGPDRPAGAVATAGGRWASCRRSSIRSSTANKNRVEKGSRFSQLSDGGEGRDPAAGQAPGPRRRRHA